MSKPTALHKMLVFGVRFYVSLTDSQFTHEFQRIAGYIATVASSLFHWMMLTASSPHSLASCSFSGIYSRYWSRQIWPRRKSSTWDLAADYRIGFVCLECVRAVGCVEKAHCRSQSPAGRVRQYEAVTCFLYSMSPYLSCHLKSIKLFHVNMKIITY